MAYTKTAWENKSPQVPINDANLNKMEEGIRTAHVTADQATTDITALQGVDSTHDTEIANLWADSSSQQAQINAVSSEINYFTWRTIDGTDIDSNYVLNGVDNVFFSLSDTGGDSTASAILPAIPTLTDQIKIVDAGQDFSTNPLRLNRNGKLIMGLAEDLILNTLNTSITLVWSGDTYGWVVLTTT